MNRLSSCDMFRQRCTWCTNSYRGFCKYCLDRLNYDSVRNGPRYGYNSNLPGQRTLNGLSYFGFGKDVIRAWKFSNNSHARSLVFEASLRFTSYLELTPETVFTWAPASALGWKERGTNPAKDLAVYLSKQFGLRTLDCYRRSDDGHQSKRSWHQRSLGPIIHWDNRSIAAHLVIVDDIVTTGTTLRACSLIAERIGVEKITTYAAAAAA